MNDHPAPLGGMCSARFDPLLERFAAKLESGEELGASLAVNIDGEMVVDRWGGWADEARTAVWTENTITSELSPWLARRCQDGVPYLHLARLRLERGGQHPLESGQAVRWDGGTRVTTESHFDAFRAMRSEMRRSQG